MLSLRPVFDVAIEPIIALPLGGIIGAIATKNIFRLTDFAASGLLKMSDVAIMLIGTGTLAGIIANSGLNASGLPAYILAPASGILMSMATASITAVQR